MASSAKLNCDRDKQAAAVSTGGLTAEVTVLRSEASHPDQAPAHLRGAAPLPLVLVLRPQRREPFQGTSGVSISWMQRRSPLP